MGNVESLTSEEKKYFRSDGSLRDIAFRCTILYDKLKGWKKGKQLNVVITPAGVLLCKKNTNNQKVYHVFPFTSRVQGWKLVKLDGAPAFLLDVTMPNKNPKKEKPNSYVFQPMDNNVLHYMDRACRHNVDQIKAKLDQNDLNKLVTATTILHPSMRGGDAKKPTTTTATTTTTAVPAPAASSHKTANPTTTTTSTTTSAKPSSSSSSSSSAKPKHTGPAPPPPNAPIPTHIAAKYKVNNIHKYVVAAPPPYEETEGPNSPATKVGNAFATTKPTTTTTTAPTTTTSSKASNNSSSSSSSSNSSSSSSGKAVAGSNNSTGKEGKEGKKEGGEQEATYVKALHTFKGELAGEDLSFAKHEIIKLLFSDPDEDWWLGTTGDREGQFPRNYVGEPFTKSNRALPELPRGSLTENPGNNSPGTPLAAVTKIKTSATNPDAGAQSKQLFLVVKCPHCNKKTKVPAAPAASLADSKGGPKPQRFNCPSCQTVFKVDTTLASAQDKREKDYLEQKIREAKQLAEETATAAAAAAASSTRAVKEQARGNSNAATGGAASVNVLSVPSMPSASSSSLSAAAVTVALTRRALSVAIEDEQLPDFNIAEDKDDEEEAKTKSPDNGLVVEVKDVVEEEEDDDDDDEEEEEEEEENEDEEVKKDDDDDDDEEDASDAGEDSAMGHSMMIVGDNVPLPSSSLLSLNLLALPTGSSSAASSNGKHKGRLSISVVAMERSVDQAVRQATLKTSPSSNSPSSPSSPSSTSSTSTASNLDAVPPLLTRPPPRKKENFFDAVPSSSPSASSSRSSPSASSASTPASTPASSSAAAAPVAKVITVAAVPAPTSVTITPATITTTTPASQLTIDEEYSRKLDALSASIVRVARDASLSAAERKKQEGALAEQMFMLNMEAKLKEKKRAALEEKTKAAEAQQAAEEQKRAATTATTVSSATPTVVSPVGPEKSTFSDLLEESEISLSTSLSALGHNNKTDLNKTEAQLRQEQMGQQAMQDVLRGSVFARDMKGLTDLLADSTSSSSSSSSSSASSPSSISPPSPTAPVASSSFPSSFPAGQERERAATTVIAISTDTSLSRQRAATTVVQHPPDAVNNSNEPLPEGTRVSRQGYFVIACPCGQKMKTKVETKAHYKCPKCDCKFVA